MNRLNKIPNKITEEKIPIKNIVFKENPLRNMNFVKKERYSHKLLENYKTQQNFFTRKKITCARLKNNV